ncbi:MAG: hypothetical protein ISR69_14800 [Gammaproteobacteria bacterium]|nr:hypothetical protein [Candidatus Brocadiales bacterium]MBL7005285.1 hypothetical protein [Gammaproteobacteria bacterium]
MKVELASCGNPDHFQDPNQPMYGCEDNHYITVKTLEEASIVCRNFIERNFLGGGNWIGGKVYENNDCIAQISITGKIMPPVLEKRNINDDMTDDKKILIAIGVGDAPVREEIENAGLELAKAYFKKNQLNPYNCFKGILYGDDELGGYWVKAEIAANKALPRDSRYDNSEIILTYTTVDK